MISRGSEWCRWEPHIHAPGTVLNNQFTGPTAWADYLSALEAATPTIEAIAVTDYYVTETYETVVAYKRAGRLPSVRLIFPNVELRLDVATCGVRPAQTRPAAHRSPGVSTEHVKLRRPGRPRCPGRSPHTAASRLEITLWLLAVTPTRFPPASRSRIIRAPV